MDDGSVDRNVTPPVVRCPVHGAVLRRDRKFPLKNRFVGKVDDLGALIEQVRLVVGDDRWNNTRVEHAMLELARTCGISVATSRVETVTGKDVLLLKRFDCEKTGKGYTRARMISGLTLLRADEAPEERER
jgi:HipA-like protein